MVFPQTSQIIKATQNRNHMLRIVEQKSLGFSIPDETEEPLDKPQSPVSEHEQETHSCTAYVSIIPDLCH